MNATSANENAYSFLLDAYETETLKTVGIWSAFPEGSMDFRPAPKSRTVLEQMDHQIQSEGGWMVKMLGIDIGDFQPKEKTQRGYIEQYSADAANRLAILRGKPEGWWREQAGFFDVQRSRAWIFLRRLNHSTHHRGQLIIYLRVLGARVPSVYGPTADTGRDVIYHFG
ncbi:MAG TPA: DinB family protein [Candidatus Acidoferrales bacterium]|nr:DinB family protein [Candidatus Acidoferrales bacterium]